MNWSERLAAAGYMTGWKVVGKLPPGPVNKLAALAATKLSGDGAGPAQLRSNLARVVGCEPSAVPNALVAQSMRRYARYWVEAFRLPTLTSSSNYPQLIAALTANTHGQQYLRQSVAAGRGVVLVLPHSGNWDMAGVWCVSQYGQFTTVAERLKPAHLYDAFVEYRQSLGFEVLPLTGGVAPYARLREVVASGGIVCLMGERDLRARGVEVDFFGEKTRMPAGAAKLAQDTGCALHTVHLWYTANGWGQSISEPLPTERPLPELVQHIADNFAAGIAAHPADWHMLQPQWLADLPQTHLAHINRGNIDGAEADGAEAAET